VTAIFLFLDLFLRFLEALSETLLHFLEFGGVGHKRAVGAVRRTQSLVLLQGGLDPVAVGRVRSKERCAAGMAFFLAHVVEETDEPLGVIAGFPRVLHPELVCLEFKLPAHPEHIHGEDEPHALEDCLKQQALQVITQVRGGLEEARSED